jgi:hypothetical protein
LEADPVIAKMIAGRTSVKRATSAHRTATLIKSSYTVAEKQ